MATKAELEVRVAELEQQLATATEGGADAVLQQKVADLEAENEQLKADLAQANSTIEALAAGDGAAPAAAKTGAVIFEVGGEKFAIASNVTIPNIGKLTPAQVAENTEAQAWLVQKNSPLITRQSGIERA